MDDDFESLFGSRAASPVEYAAPKLALPSGPTSGVVPVAGRTYVGTIALPGLPQRSEIPSLPVASTPSVASTDEAPARGTKRRRAQSPTRRPSPPSYVPLPMDVPDLAMDAPSNLLRSHPNLLGVAGQVSGLRPQSLNPRGSSRNPIRLHTPQPPRDPPPPPPPASGPVQKANPAVQQLLGDASFVNVLETLLPPVPARKSPSARTAPTCLSTPERRTPPAAAGAVIRRIPRVGMRHAKPARRPAQQDGQTVINTAATSPRESARSVNTEMEAELSTFGPCTSWPGTPVASSSNLPLVYNSHDESDSVSITTSTPSLSHSITDSPVSTTIDMFDDFDALLQPATTMMRPQLSSVVSAAGEGLEAPLLEDPDLSSLLALLGDNTPTKLLEPQDTDFAALLEQLGGPSL